MSNWNEKIALQLQLNESDLAKYEAELEDENITTGGEIKTKDEIGKRKYCIKVLKALLDD